MHPLVYYRDCSRCLIYHYDEETGKESTRNGRPIKRPPGTVPPCRKATGSECPKGTPEQPVTLTVRSRLLWEYYRKCKLTGRWPDDDWLISLFVKLDELLRQCESTRESQKRAMEMQLLTAGMMSHVR